MIATTNTLQREEGTQGLSREHLHASFQRFAGCSADLATQAFAGVISHQWSRRGFGEQPIYGLRAEDTRALLDHYFPGLAGYLEPQWPDSAACQMPEDRDDEIADLSDLLLDYRNCADRESAWVAYAVATGCMGQDHLWHDMGMPDRKALSKLLEKYFPLLAFKNVNDMKWKNFFYKQLCERAGINVCKAPSCGECVDYERCFGPEEGPA